MDSSPRTPNERLLRQREIRGWSQREVAREIGTTEKRISAWEQGTNEPSAFYQEKLCALFNKNIEELGFRVRNPETPIPSTIQDTNDMTEWLDQAEVIVNLCWELWFASRSEQAAQEIFKLLPRLYKTSRESISLIHQFRAQHLAVRCHGLIGAICLDRMENDTALYHFTGACRMAGEIHDLDQATAYLAQIGNVLQHKGDKLAAINRMELAHEQAVAAKVSYATQGHILQFLAYAYADIGNASGFERAISEATDLLSFAGEGLDLVRHEFMPFGLCVIRGTVNRNVGKPMEAIPYLNLAEKSLASKPVAPRWNALIQICKAQAFCDAGDLNVGIELAKQGFLLADACQSPQQMHCVKKLLHELEASEYKEDKRVGDLRELLHEVYIRG